MIDLVRPNIFTTNDKGEAVVRITTEPAIETFPESIYGVDKNGFAAVRVIGDGTIGGGGDRNIDGGFANSVYTPVQHHDGGNARG